MNHVDWSFNLYYGIMYVYWFYDVLICDIWSTLSSEDHDNFIGISTTSTMADEVTLDASVSNKHIKSY